MHYPGNYLAGVYNRLDSSIDGTVVRDESMVNIPNWLPLTLHHADGTPLDPDHGTLQAYRQELDLRRGLLTRSFVHEDPTGRATRITERRLVSQAARHLAALQTSIEALNWSGNLQVRSIVNGDVAKTGVAEYQHLASRHLLPPTATELGPGPILLETVTSQSKIQIAFGHPHTGALQRRLHGHTTHGRDRHRQHDHRPPAPTRPDPPDADNGGESRRRRKLSRPSHLHTC